MLVSGLVASVVVAVVADGSEASVLKLVVIVVDSRSLSRVGFGAEVVGGVLVVRRWVVFLEPIVAIEVVCCAKKKRKTRQANKKRGSRRA